MAKILRKQKIENIGGYGHPIMKTTVTRGRVNTSRGGNKVKSVLLKSVDITDNQLGTSKTRGTKTTVVRKNGVVVKNKTKELGRRKYRI